MINLIHVIEVSVTAVLVSGQGSQILTYFFRACSKFHQSTASGKFEHALNQKLELPNLSGTLNKEQFLAGKLDPGEDRLACARRELQEETGYVARQWARAGVIHPVISYSTEFIEIWFAKDLTAGERRLDAGEFLDVFTATPTQLAAWCREGVVTDAKTVAGMLWVNAVLSGEWRLEWDEPIP